MPSFWNRFKSWLDGDNHISLDDAEILSNHRRRSVIKSLSESSHSTVDLSDISIQATKMEFGEDYTRDERKSVYSSLHGSHLDKMADADTVDYRSEDCLKVSKKPKVNELYPFIEDSPSDDSLFYEFNEDHELAFTADLGFKALGNFRSRFVINYMSEAASCDLDTLYKQLASEEKGCHISELNPSDWKKQYVALKQVHIPSLEDIQVLNYNEDTKTVHEGENLEILSKHISPDEYLN